MDAALDTSLGRFVEQHSGDLCSALGIAGAAMLLLGRRNPGVELAGERVVIGSMGAAAVDVGVQSWNAATDRTGSSGKEAGPGTIAYAATGLIPAVSIHAIRGLHPHPSRREVAALALLGVNGAVLGYELLTRGPGIARGEEDLSGYGSLAASLGGFVVARHLLTRA